VQLDADYGVQQATHAHGTVQHISNAPASCTLWVEEVALS